MFVTCKLVVIYNNSLCVDRVQIYVQPIQESSSPGNRIRVSVLSYTQISNNINMTTIDSA